MFFAIDLNTVTHGIQLAVAPVFLLTAVAGMIGTAVGRLARIIDRARVLEERIETTSLGNPVKLNNTYTELECLRTRGGLVNACIGLLTFCALLIGLTIVMLFLGETADLQTPRMAMVCFLGGVICFLLALLCFLAETLLATRILKFARPQTTPN